MQVTVEKLPKSSLKLNIKVPVEKVKDTYEKVLDQAVEITEIEGFRRGKAPREQVKTKVGQSNLYGEVVNTLLQTYYPQALKEQKISPIANPKVEIKSFDIDKDFEFIANVAIRPEISVGDYKATLKKVYAERLEQRKKEVEEANKEHLAKGETLEEVHFHLSPNEVVDVITKATTLDVPDILVEEETDRLMARLVDQAQTIGLSLEQYLKSQNKTADQLKAEYKAHAEKNITAEFALSNLVGIEKIEVTDEEIDQVVSAVGDDKTKAKMSEPYERMYIKTVLQKNKLLSNIIQEIEGENFHEHKE